VNEKSKGQPEMAAPFCMRMEINGKQQQQAVTAFVIFRP
jgi:hypothetical protein